MRLIDADALLPMIKYATIDSEIGVFPIKIGFNAIKKVIDEAPTIDAVPIRHGKWIRTGRKNVYGGYELECPVCGDKVMVQNIECELYCRNCGARMDEE